MKSVGSLPARNDVPPRTPPTCGCSPCTPLSSSATVTPRPVRPAKGASASVKRTLVRLLDRAGRKQIGERLPEPEQRLGRAFLDDAAVLEHEHAVGPTRQLEAMRDENCRTASHDGLVAGGD